jgi:uncharacterized Tic20 family protein
MENPTPSSSPAPLPSNPSPAPPSAERNWCLWCHLSGLVVPMGNILGPVIIWQMKRAEFPAVDEHGKEALNFQLSVLIYLLGGGVITFLGMLLCIGWLLVPVLCLIPVVALIFTIIAGVKAGDGVLYRYPLTLRLVK